MQAARRSITISTRYFLGISTGSYRRVARLRSDQYS